jgi:hypothetical protein
MISLRSLTDQATTVSFRVISKSFTIRVTIRPLRTRRRAVCDFEHVTEPGTPTSISFACPQYLNLYLHAHIHVHLLMKRINNFCNICLQHAASALVLRYNKPVRHGWKPHSVGYYANPCCFSVLSATARRNSEHQSTPKILLMRKMLDALAFVFQENKVAVTDIQSFGHSTVRVVTRCQMTRVNTERSLKIKQVAT